MNEIEKRIKEIVVANKEMIKDGYEIDIYSLIVKVYNTGFQDGFNRALEEVKQRQEEAQGAQEEPLASSEGQDSDA